MKNTLTFLLILSSITYGIGQNVIKPTLLGGISGTIQDAKNGKPVPGATVMLYAKSNAKNNKIITSDKNGEFLFEKIPFDYYQIYDCSPEEIGIIKKRYNKKIITALTINDETDVQKHHVFSEVTDIYLFDSKGYEKSMAFDHSLIEKIKINKPLMIAGNIQVNDNLENYKKIADIIDISGGLETSGLKDKSKIDIFLNKVKNET
mgnify:CR=1 FL=1